RSKRDWSSDVCSSDLATAQAGRRGWTCTGASESEEGGFGVRGRGLVGSTSPLHRTRTPACPATGAGRAPTASRTHQAETLLKARSEERRGGKEGRLTR